MNFTPTRAFAPLAIAVATIVALGGCASTKDTSSTTPVAQAPNASSQANASTSASTQPAANAQTPLSAAGKPAALAVYFDYDSFTVKDQYTAAVRSNAEYLSRTNGAIELDGNADERGSREYNMALGQKRADAVKRAMAAFGAKTDRIETVSFGEDKPKSNGHDESAWAENRRVDAVLKSR